METLYKATDENATCRGYQYTVGKLHVHEGEVSICNSGFHACRKLEDVFNYYDSSSELYICEGNIVAEGDDKVVCDQIRLIRKITIKDLWERRDKAWIIRLMIVKHPKVTRKMLEELTKNTDYDVGMTIVGSPKINAKILNILSKNGSWVVRESVADHPKATLKILKALAKDDDDDVRRTARERLKEHRKVT